MVELDPSKPKLKRVLIDIAKGDDLDVRNLREQPDVVKAALANAAHRQADAFVRAWHLLPRCQAGGACQCRKSKAELSSSRQELAPVQRER
jgi:hypothetical protein